MEEALFMAEDAARGGILTELEEGDRQPKARKLQDIHSETEWLISLVALDMDA